MRSKLLVLAVLLTPVALALLIAPSLPAPKLTVSKRTTFFTEPLTEDGWPDYLVALNRLKSDGVTPENNAAVPFWQAMGPERVEEAAREEFFAGLGMAVPPKDGHYLTPLGGMENEEEGYLNYEQVAQADKECGEAQERPWSAAEFPLVARWLERNREPLDRIVEGCRRSRWYEPLVRDGIPALFCAHTPGLPRRMEARDMLLARAMLRICEAEHRAAMEDLLTLRRLGRLSSRGSLIDYVVGSGLDGEADTGFLALLADPAAPPGFRQTLASGHRELPPFADPVEVVDIFERCGMLDFTCAGMRAPGKLNEVCSAFWSAIAPTRVAPWHWDGVLISLNDSADRLAEILREPDHAARREAVRKIGERAEALGDRIKSPIYLESPVHNSNDRTPRAAAGLTGMLLGVGPTLHRRTDEVSLRARMRQVVFALAAHHEENGGYPEELSEILDPVPMDTFADGPLAYERTGDGFVLRSVGPDGERTPEEKKAWWGDDIVFRVPVGK